MVRGITHALLAGSVGAALWAFPAAAETPPAKSAQNPSFNLINRTDVTIREVYATPSGMENWGHSRLEGKTIAPGATFPVRLLADGNCVYDIRVVFTDGKVLERHHVDTCRVDDLPVGPPSPAPTAAPAAAPATTHPPSFRLINRGKSPITEVTATPADATAPGANLLADGATLAPQDARQFDVQASSGVCRFNLRVVFADKQSREKKAADLCRTGDLPVQ